MSESLIKSDCQYTECPNCGHQNIEKFCANCGQSNVNLNRPIYDIFSDLFGLINLDKRIKHTIVPLFFRPDYLTKEYFRGRRKRYLPPMKLYLFSSFLFFFITQININMTENISESIQINDSTSVLNMDSSDIANVKILADSIIHLSNDDEDFAPLDSANFNWQEIVEKTLETTKIDKVNLKDFVSKYSQYCSYGMFLLLPLFAFLLRLLYIRRSRFYANHLIFAINLHSFVLILLSLLLLLQYLFPILAGNKTLIALLLVTLYAFFGLKNYYQQTYFKTLIKMSILALVYCFFLVTTLFAIFIIALIVKSKYGI